MNIPIIMHQLLKKCSTYFRTVPNNKAACTNCTDCFWSLHRIFLFFLCPLDRGRVRLVTTKYYRGKNADGKDGSGLGLYIADPLMEKMNGELICSCKSEGFQVTLLLPLS